MKFKIEGDIIQWNESIIDFQRAMRTIDENEPIEMEINSYGGDAFLGIDIANTLKGHPADVTVTVTGIAASAASIITAAAKTVRMYSSSQIMIHNPMTIAMGSSSELRKSADTLDKVGDSIIASYSHRMDAADAKKKMDDETFMTAEEAVQNGLADEVIDKKAEPVNSIAFENAAKDFNEKYAKSVETPEEDKVTVKVEMDDEVLGMFNSMKEEIKAMQDNQATLLDASKAKEPQTQNSGYGRFLF